MSHLLELALWRRKLIIYIYIYMVIFLRVVFVAYVFGVVDLEKLSSVTEIRVKSSLHRSVLELGR